jgi:hypothetical protein
MNTSYLPEIQDALQDPNIAHIAEALIEVIKSDDKVAIAHGLIALMRQDYWSLVPVCLDALAEANIHIDLPDTQDIEEIGLALAKWQNQIR